MPLFFHKINKQIEIKSINENKTTNILTALPHLTVEGDVGDVKVVQELIKAGEGGTAEGTCLGLAHLDVVLCVGVVGQHLLRLA